MAEINVRSSAQMIRGLGGRGGRRAARSAAIIDGAFQAGRALKSAPAPARADLLNETNVKHEINVTFSALDLTLKKTGCRIEFCECQAQISQCHTQIPEIFQLKLSMMDIVDREADAERPRGG